MKNAHLVVPVAEEVEYLPPKWCLGFLATMFVLFVAAGYLIINHWIIKVDDLQGQLWSAQTRVDELQKENNYLNLSIESLEKENETLKCEAYFYAD